MGGNSLQSVSRPFLIGGCAGRATCCRRCGLLSVCGSAARHPRRPHPHPTCPQQNTPIRRPVCIGPPTPGGQQRTVAVTGAAMFLELIQIVATRSADP
jgi:hypothetical protein